MIGVDEVGRGCLAGPLLVVAARQTGKLPDGVKDSKLLSKQNRLKIISELVRACEFGEGWVTPLEIDNAGIGEAMRLGIGRALSELDARENEAIILDGKVNYIPERYTQAKCIVKADRDIGIVSAASIYAKVKRDAFMANLQIEHPGYGFEYHAGYGTLKHLTALKELGALSGVHRYSFRPVSLLLQS